MRLFDYPIARARWPGQLQLFVDGLGFGVSLCVALEFLDPLAVGFDGILQRLALCVDLCESFGV